MKKITFFFASAIRWNLSPLNSEKLLNFLIIFICMSVSPKITLTFSLESCRKFKSRSLGELRRKYPCSNKSKGWLVVGLSPIVCFWDL